MSKLDELIDLIRSTKNKFVAICTNTNRDYPFYDYFEIEFEERGE